MVSCVSIPENVLSFWNYVSNCTDWDIRVFSISFVVFHLSLLSSSSSSSCFSLHFYFFIHLRAKCRKGIVFMERILFCLTFYSILFCFQIIIFEVDVLKCISFHSPFTKYINIGFFSLLSIKNIWLNVKKTQIRFDWCVRIYVKCRLPYWSQHRFYLFVCLFIY